MIASSSLSHVSEEDFLFNSKAMEYTEEEYNKAIGQKYNFDDILDSCVTELKGSIRKTIKDRWSNGDSVTGGKIKNLKTGGGYSQLSYKALKLIKNPRAGGLVDLTFTGALGDAIDVIKSTSNNYEILSLDSKYNEIGEKYGFDEFGLDAEEMNFYMSLLSDMVIEKIINLNL